MRPLRWSPLLTALLAVAVATPLAAQSGPRPVCIRPAPLAECRSFVLFEARGQSPFVQPERLITWEGRHVSGDGEVTEVHQTLGARELSHSIGWDVGYAWNVAPRWALGATVGYEFGEASRRRTAAVRLRHWVTDGIALEVVPGVFRLAEVGGGTRDETRTGGNVAARVALWDVAVVALRWDFLPVDGSRSETDGVVRLDPGGVEHNVSVGFGLESVTGFVASGVGILALAVALGVALGGVS